MKEKILKILLVIICLSLWFAYFTKMYDIAMETHIREENKKTFTKYEPPIKIPNVKAVQAELRSREAEICPVEAEKDDETIFIQIFGYKPLNDEIELCKRVAMAESGNTEPIEGIERVIEVIANRCRDDWFPDTITEVCYQKNQFQTVEEGTIWKYEINDRVETAWNNLVERGYCADEVVLFFTAGKYNPYCTPMYQLGNHYFGR